MTVENFLKELSFEEEVRIIDYDNMDVFRGCAFAIPNEYYQREIRSVFSQNLFGNHKCCTCIVIK
jgi:hypothetical protein|nr:MAG TPA: hypothetical protein [Caudoviricetes sp.]